MLIKYFQIVVVTTLLLFRTCDNCRSLPKAEPASFTVSCEVEESTVHLEDHKRVKYTVYIDPENEVAQKAPYYQVLDWTILGGIKGELFGPEGEKINADTRLKNGENIFFYEPGEEGDHTITLQVTDKYNDLKREIIFPSITVEKKPTPYFKVILKTTSKNIFSHQTAPIELEITSEDPEAKKLSYTIKKVEVSQGSLQFADGKEVKSNSKLTFGKQNLILKPAIQAGNIKIKLVVSHTRGESATNLTLEVKPLNFTIELKTASNQIFSYQTAPIDLTLLSPVEGAKDLAYTIKQISVTKGELQFEESGRKVEAGNQIKYGTQHVVFKPNGEIGQARIDLTVINTETGSESNKGLALEIKPLNFKPNIWLKEPTEEERKLIKEDFAVLEVMLSGVDKKLVDESWKIIDWKFSDEIQRTITDKQLKELTEFPIKAEGDNQFYVRLPNIKLGQDPSLTIRVEGPGKSIQEAIVQLAPIQKKIVKNHQDKLLGSIQQQVIEIDKHLKLPVKGENYAPIKAVSQTAKRQLATFQDSLAAIQASTAELRSREVERIGKEIRTLENKKEKLHALQKECKKKNSSFNAELKAITRKFFNHQTAVIILELLSEEEGAKGLNYAIKNIDVTKGTLHFGNGEQIKAGSKLIFGTQNLTFKPSGELGESEIRLTIENSAGVERTTSIVLEAQPVIFKAELQPTSSTILNHKDISLPLIISSKEAEARELTYTVKEIEVTKGTLQFENGERIKAGSHLMFGTQNVTFKPNGEIGRARIKLTVSSNTNSESTIGIVMEVKPVTFKTELKSDTKSIFSHQNAVFTLDITSNDEGAASLDYTVKDLEVLNGNLYFGSDDRQVKTGSKLRFGWQTLVFKPTEDKKDGEIKAIIQFTITNGKGSESMSSLALLINPIEFKVDAWIKRPAKKDKKLIQENSAVLKIKLSNIDQELIEESWKLVGWSCSEDVQIGITAGSSLKELSEFSLDNKKKNTFYLRLPSIRLDSEPILMLQVQGPGNTVQETAVQLSSIQKAIINERLEACISAISHLERKMDDCLKLPVAGKNYYIAKEVGEEAIKQIAAAREMLSEDVKAAFDKHSERVFEGLRTIEKKKEELDAFKEACEQKKISFKAELSASSKAIFTHQISPIVLRLSSDEEEVENLVYTVKEIEVTKGTLHFENGKKVKAGSILPFGTQNLIFKPSGEIGEAQVDLAIQNNKGREINTGLVLHVKPIEFKVDAWVKEPTEKEKDLMIGDFGVVEVKFSEIGRELANESWKILDWKLSDAKNPIHSDQKVDSLFIENSKVSQIQKAIGTLVEKVRAKEKELVDVKVKLGRSKEQLEMAKEGVRSSERQIEKVAEKVEEFKKELKKAAEEQIGRANERLKYVEKQVGEFDKKYVEKQVEVEEAEERLGEREENIKKSYVKKDKDEENVKNATVDLEKAEKKVNKFKRKIKGFQESSGRSKGQLETAEESYKALQKELEEFQKELKEFIDKGRNEGYGTLKEAQEHIKKEREYIEKKKEYIEKIETARKKVNSIEGDIKACKHLIKSFTKHKLPEAERRVKINKETLAEAKAKLEVITKYVEVLTKQAEEDKEALKKARVLEEAAKKQVEEAKKELGKAEEQAEEAKKELRIVEEKVEKKKQEELRLAEVARKKQEETLKAAAEKVKRVANKLKMEKKLFEAQRKKTEEKIQHLKVELEMEKKLQDTKDVTPSFKPVLLNKELDGLSAFSMDSKEKNQLYLKLPTIKLETEPILSLQVEGPGKTIKEVAIHLSELQHKIITSKMEKSLEALKKLSKEVDYYKQLPVTGNNYSKIKSFTKEIDPQIRRIFSGIEASCGAKWVENPVILSLPVAQDIVREMHSLERNKARLSELKKECKEKGVSFKAELNVASKSLLNYQTIPITLELTSGETGAEELQYTIKEIDVRNGELCFDSDSKVRHGDKISFGRQNLTFKSTGQIGDAKIRLAIVNGKGGESTTGMVLKVKPIRFKTELHVESRKLFIYQAIPITLKITSDIKEAEELQYTIQEIEVKNGELYFDNRSKVKKGDKLEFGAQTLTFKTTDQVGDASIHISLDNGKGTDMNTGLLLDIRPINFRIDAWLREPQEDEKKLMQGNSAVLEIMLSDVEDELVKGPWKLIEWKLNDNLTHASQVPSLKRSSALKGFGNALQNLNLSLLEGASEQKIKNKIQALEDKKEDGERLIIRHHQYRDGMLEKARKGQAAINAVEGKLRSITSSYQPSMALVTLHEARSQEKGYREGKHMLELTVQQLSREIELQGKRIERENGLKEIQDKKIVAKLDRLHSALKVMSKLKDVQSAVTVYNAQPPLLDFGLRQLTAYPLKVGEVNEFHLTLPNVSIFPTLTLQVEGPEKIVKEVVIELASYLQPIAARKVAEALKSIRNISSNLDEYLRLPLAGSSYEKLREASQKVKVQLKEVLKDIESYYGRAWWRSPIILSLKDLENVVEEMVILDKKKEKLSEFKKACKQKRLSFRVDATLKQPEGDRILLMTYAVLRIKLLDVDESLANEDWKLLGWQSDDQLPRGIIDRDLHELAEFPLSSKGENELYLKLPNLDIITTPTLTLQIGISGKTVQEVILELAPVQNTIMGKEISQFLEVIQKLNKEVADYLNLPIKEKRYDKLTDFSGQVKTKLNFYNNVYNSAKEKYQTDPKKFAKILPGASGRDLIWVIENGIPALEANQVKLDKELDDWDKAIEECILLEKASKEQCISSIYNPDIEGNLLTHRLLDRKYDINASTFEALVQRMPDINTRNNKGYTLLHLAVRNRDLEKVKVLLNNEASQGYGAPLPDGSGYGYTPMHYVVASTEPNSYEIMLALMEKWNYANYDDPSDERDRFLMSVIRTSNFNETEKTDRVRKLLECGVPPDSRMQNGGYSLYLKDTKWWTPLYAAIEREYLEICNLLLQRIAKTSGRYGPSHPNVLLKSGKYSGTVTVKSDKHYNIYPHFLNCECTSIYKNNSTYGKMYDLLDSYGYLRYDKEYVKDCFCYEFNPYN